MYFPKFWARGSSQNFSCWGWSDHSITDARSRAETAARKLSSQFGSTPPSKGAQYQWYSTRPLREEIIQELQDTGGERTACITRNRYGALVLNTANIMFLDVDFPEENARGTSFIGFVKSLFGGNDTSSENPETHALKRIESWCQRNRSSQVRAYRTAQGLRLLFLHQKFDPERIVGDKICAELGVDPLYQKLCAAQKSFRARLTPKPWRCDLAQAPVGWPWENGEAENRFRAWEKEYAKVCETHATCKLLEQFGSRAADPAAQQIMELHDMRTKAQSSLPLA